MSTSSTICLNLGPRESRKRRLLGLLAFNIGIVLAIFFIWQNVDDLLRATVFIPFFFAYLGILQSLQKTCVFLAIQGKQNLDQGNEQVAEDALRRKLWHRSLWIIFWAATLALLCTYLTLAIHPELMEWPRAAAVPPG
ncbi:MAG TPA: hypothetical protein PLX97_07905 [Gemmatales bacterium]|nr:hypothetical protein [Gemmatales bacterium]